MDKKFYNIELVPGTSEADFLANDAAGMTLHDNLDLFDMLLVMKLTEDEAIQYLGREQSTQAMRDYLFNWGAKVVEEYPDFAGIYRTKFLSTVEYQYTP